jgi:hypothetical protein
LTYDGASAAHAAPLLRGAAAARRLAVLVGFRVFESVNNVMQQGHSSDTVNYAALPEIIRLLRKSDVHNCVYESPLLAPLLKKVNSVHTAVPPYLLIQYPWFTAARKKKWKLEKQRFISF